MLPSTSYFQEQIKASVRRFKSRVQIDYTDSFLDPSIEAGGNENNNISNPDQVTDSVEEPDYKYAALDGTWVLDGTYHLASSKVQVGWWGSTLAGTGGDFSPPYPTLTVTFFSRPIHHLKVVGDSKRGEWPVDFVVRLYSGDDVVHTETVTGNQEIAWRKNIFPITQVSKMELEIQRWSHEGRVVKILEFFSAVSETYEGDDILLISLQEERKISDGSLPIGNISANEIEVRLNNIDRKFDAGNVDSPLYQLLKANRRIKAWIGLVLTDEAQYFLGPNIDTSKQVFTSRQFSDTDAFAELVGYMLGIDHEWIEEVEWKPLGTFWSGDWHTPEGEVYAHTTGRDRLELLRKTTFSTSQVFQNTNLYELAEIVLQDAGLEPDEYWIDEELKEYDIPYAWFEPVSHREALRQIAEACLGQVYMDRNGVLRIEGPSFLEEERAVSQTTITADDYFMKDQPVQWSQITNYIEVYTNPLRPAETQEIYRSSEPETIEAGQTRTITIFYDKQPAIDTVASIEGTGTIQNVNYYAWGADVTVYSPTSGEFEIVVQGRPLEVQGRERIIAQNQESIIDNGSLRYQFPDNHLIQRRSIAQKIAQKLLVFSDARRDIEIEWRGNPAMELADRFTAPDFKEESFADFYVVSQSLEFDGSLRSRIQGRRAM